MCKTSGSSREGGREGRKEQYVELSFFWLFGKEEGRGKENEMNEIPYLGTKQSEKRRKSAMLVVCRRREGGREERQTSHHDHPQ